MKKVFKSTFPDADGICVHCGDIHLIIYGLK